MFLKGGPLEAVDAIAYGWNGNTRIIASLKFIQLNLRKLKLHRFIHTANIEVIDHENDPLKYRWVIMDESKVKVLEVI